MRPDRKRMNRRGQIGAVRLVIAVAAVTTLGACTLYGPPPSDGSGIGFREARFNEIAAMREYRACRDEALDLDRQARATGNAGRYLASARLIEKCESAVGPDVNGIAEDERVRAYALSIQNYIRGGDLESARNNLQTFQAAFPGKDLYYTDGSSFIDTTRVLLGQVESHDLGPYSTLNVNDDLKTEMRRVAYWRKN